MTRSSYSRRLWERYGQTCSLWIRGDADRLADDDRGQRLVAQQAAREAADVVDLDRRDQGRALGEMIRGEVVDLHGVQQARDGARRIERQRQRPGEIGLGVGKLLFGRAGAPKPRQLG